MRTYNFFCDKLVRDKMLGTMVARGLTPEVRKLAPHEYIPYLKRKIYEEAEGLSRTTTTSALMDELIDLSEAIEALKTALQCSEEHFEHQSAHKKDRYGKFQERHCLYHICIPEDHPDLSHFLRNSHQYRCSIPHMCAVFKTHHPTVHDESGV